MCFGCSNADKPSAEVVRKPNVVFILADDLGYSDLSCMGSNYYETPNIDRLAGLGVTFINGYANCQVCSPSRASIMTGQWPASHGITDWIGAKAGTDWRSAGRHDRLLPAEYVHALPDSVTTLAEAFRAGGYRTFFAGKWHLGGEGSWPTDHGFDLNVGGWDAGSPAGGYFDPYENPNLPNRSAGENLSMRLARETADFIGANRDTSFLAYLSFYAVHGPIQTTREKWEKYRQKIIAQGVEAEGFAMERVLPYRLHQDYPVYAGLVEQMDDAVGVVLDTLTTLGLLDNTIIVFTSDNGGVVSGDGFATNLAPLRGGKGYQWEGGIKVPYIIYAPAKTTAGAMLMPSVTGADLYPTLLDLAGLPARPGDHRDGTSLVATFSGDTLPERDLVWHYPHYGNQGGEPSSIIKRGEWKLIHYYEDGRDELYHLGEDVGETEDLASTFPDRAEAMASTLLDLLEERNARYPEPDPAYDPRARREVLARYREQLMPRLEGERSAQYEADWQPNEAWWGSRPTRE